VQEAGVPSSWKADAMSPQLPGATLSGGNGLPIHSCNRMMLERRLTRLTFRFLADVDLFNGAGR
jgi:hypothetical protein